MFLSVDCLSSHKGAIPSYLSSTKYIVSFLVSLSLSLSFSLSLSLSFSRLVLRKVRGAQKQGFLRNKNNIQPYGIQNLVGRSPDFRTWDLEYKAWNAEYKTDTYYLTRSKAPPWLGSIHEHKKPSLRRDLCKVLLLNILHASLWGTRILTNYFFHFSVCLADTLESCEAYLALGLCGPDSFFRDFLAVNCNATCGNCIRKLKILVFCRLT